MKNYKVILLLDMDSFFASCHMTENKDLIGKAIVVATPNNNSVVSSCSYQARSLGIKAGMPLYKVKNNFKDLIIVRPNFSLYSSISYKVFDLIKTKFTNKIEIASIDECYIDATNIWRKYKSVRNLCNNIKNTIKREMGITCSIGASYNKFLAKMACPLNKPDGVTILKGYDFKTVLWPLEIENMYGVGKSTAEKLRLLGINTIGDLANYDRGVLLNKLSKRFANLIANSNGNSSNEVDWAFSNNKSLSNELTLDTDINDYNELKDILYSLTQKTWQRLMMRNMECKNISIQLTNRIRNNEPYNKKKHNISRSKSCSLEKETNNFTVIYNKVIELFDSIFFDDDIHKIGISFNWIDERRNKTKQLTINEIDSDSNDSKDILKKLNIIIGPNKLKTGDKISKNKQFQTKIFSHENRHLSHKEIKEKKMKK